MAGHQRIYLAWDLAVASTLPIMGAFAIRDGGGPCDIVVEQGAVPAPLRNDTAPYALTDSGLTVTVPDVARFACRPDAVRVEADPHASGDMVAALLIATALPAVLWMRGDLLLHAAAVEAGLGAVGFLAPTGGGKSTLAEALVRRGHRLVADDTVRVFADGGGIAAAGLPGRLFRRVGDSRVSRAVTPALRRASAPLHRVVELVPDLAEPAEAVDGMAAVAVLLRHRHRPTIPRLLELDASLLPRFTDLAHRVRVSRWPADRAAALAGDLAIDRPPRHAEVAAVRHAVQV